MPETKYFKQKFLYAFLHWEVLKLPFYLWKRGGSAIFPMIKHSLISRVSKNLLYNLPCKPCPVPSAGSSSIASGSSPCWGPSGSAPWSSGWSPKSSSTFRSLRRLPCGIYPYQIPLKTKIRRCLHSSQKIVAQCTVHFRHSLYDDRLLIILRSFEFWYLHQFHRLTD